MIEIINAEASPPSSSILDNSNSYLNVPKSESQDTLVVYLHPHQVEMEGSNPSPARWNRQKTKNEASKAKTLKAHPTHSKEIKR